MNLYKLLSITAMFALVFSLSYCKKETVTETVTVTVHDTLKGKAISGVVKYPDYAGVQTPAKGAVINLYTGSSTSGTLVATAFADANGNYTLPYLLPGSYFIYAKYNTENQNVREIQGINFATDPGYAVTLGTSDLVQDLDLVSIASSGSMKIALDTINANQTFRKVSWEIHSKMDFSFPDHETGILLPGGFNVFNVDKFAFDESNPANISISGYVLLSTVNTFEPVRDALAAGCVRKTLNVDTIDQYTPLPETDTARFTSLSVEKYGDGYIAHGVMTAFYKHGPGEAYPADTVGGYAGPWDTRISKNVDLYFVYEGKQKFISGANYNWMFVFEGQLKLNPKNDFYLTSSHFGAGDIDVNLHTMFKGANNTEY